MPNMIVVGGGEGKVKITLCTALYMLQCNLQGGEHLFRGIDDSIPSAGRMSERENRQFQKILKGVGILDYSLAGMRQITEAARKGDLDKVTRKKFKPSYSKVKSASGIYK